MVLMDIELPDINGLEVARRLTQEFPAVKVIVLSGHATGPDVMKASPGWR